MKNLSLYLVTGAAVFAAMPAFAQDTQFVPDEDIALIEDEERQGFDGLLSIGANLNFTSNSNVVGQVDGYSTLFGLSLKGGLDYLYKKHEVRNTLSIQESFARTPVIDEFVKNSDVVEFESLYNYFFLKWLGAFGRLSFQTSILPSEAVSADPTAYEITRLDGTIENESTTRLSLADPFSPFTINESIGGFVEPLRSEAINASFRLGFGARQTLASGVLATNDDADTADVIEIVELDNVIQAGAEAFVGAKGKFYDKRISYEVGATALVPFLNNDDTDRSAFDLMRYGLNVTLSTNVFSWMALTYDLRILKDPQLIDATQVQNGLLLTFNYTFIERDGGTAGPSADELLAEAQRKLAEAEEECAELRENAQEARSEAEEAKIQEMEKEHQQKLLEEQKRIQQEELQKQQEQAPVEGETTPPAEGTTPPAEEPVAPATPE